MAPTLKLKNKQLQKIFLFLKREYFYLGNETGLYLDIILLHFLDQEIFYLPIIDHDDDLLFSMININQFYFRGLFRI